MTRLDSSPETGDDDLRTTPLARVLLDLFEGRRTGTLLVRAEDGAMHAAIRVDAGRPLAVLAAETGARRVTDVVMPLCALTEGRFEFRDGQDLVGHDGLWAAGPIDPLPMITTATRDWPREDAVAESMKLIARSLVRLRVGLDLRRYGLNAEELLVIAGLAQGPAELEELYASVQVAPEVVRRVLYVLHLTRAITLSPLRRTVSGTVFHAAPLASPSMPPPGRTVPPSSVAPTQRPLSAAPSQRPASVPSQRPGSVGPSQTPPLRRSSVPAAPSLPPRSTPPGDERAQRERIDAIWQQAEALSRRSAHEAALRTAREAVKLGTPSPAREALLGWLIYQHDGAGGIANPHVWKCFNHALQRDPLCEEALYYKGLVLGRTGEADHAHAHFERVLMLDPEHRGAAREIRIHQMRREHARQQTGFLRKLLSSRPAPKKE
jgi:hypothetical protein